MRSRKCGGKGTHRPERSGRGEDGRASIDTPDGFSIGAAEEKANIVADSVAAMYDLKSMVESREAG